MTAYILGFTIFPILRTIVMGFTDSHTNALSFKNYLYLFNWPAFAEATINTAVFGLISMHHVDLYLRKRSMILELYIEYENCYPFSQFIGYLREHSIDLTEMEFTKGIVSAPEYQSAIIMINGKRLGSRDEVLAVVSASPGMRYFAEL